MGGSREGISVPRKSVEDGHQYRVGRTGVPGWKNRSTFKRYSAFFLVDGAALFIGSCSVSVFTCAGDPNDSLRLI